MAKEFSVSLGIDFNNKGLKNVKTQLNNLTDNNHRIRIDIDNSRLLKQIDHAKKELKDLSGIKGNNRPLEINTKSLEQSFNRIANVIDEIKISIGTFGQDANMKPLLASINEISTSLSEVSKQFKELSSSFNGFNLNFNLGGNKNQVANNIAYAEKIKSNVIPQLKEQARQLEEYLKTVYKVEDGQEAVIKLVSKTGEFSKLIGLVGKESFVSDDYDADYKEILSTYREYIALIERAAKTRGVDLSSVTSNFSKSADQMMQDARKIQTGETEAEESMQRLQKIFGGSNVDTEGLTAQLDSIIIKLTEIGETVAKLSSGVSIDGLTESFNNLSSSIQQIVDNCTIVKTVITDSIDGVSASVKKTENTVNNISDINLKTTAEQIKNMKAAMGDFGFDEGSINVAIKELENMNLVINKITTKLNEDGSVRLSIQGIDKSGRVVTAVKRVHQEFIELADGSKQLMPIVDDLGKTISQSFNQVVKQPEEVVDAFNRMRDIILEVSSIRVKLTGLNPEKNANEINVLKSRLGELSDEYQKLDSTFNKSFNSNQIDSLDDAWDSFIDKLNVANAKMADNSKENYFREIGNFAKQMGKLELKIGKLNIETNPNEVAELTSQLNNLQKEYDSFISSFNFNDPNLTIGDISRLNQAFADTQNQLKILQARMADISAARQQKEAAKQTAQELDNLFKAAKGMESLELEIGKLKISGGKENEIKALESTLKSVREEYNKLIASFNFNDPNLTIDDFAKLNAIFEKTQSKLDQFEGKAKDTKASFAKGIKLSIEADDFDKEFNRINTTFKSLETQSKDCKKAVQEFNIAFTNLKKASESGNDDALINAQKEYAKALKKVNNQLVINTNSQKQANKELKKAKADQDLGIRRTDLIRDIDIWLQDNTAAAKQFKAQLVEIKSQIASADGMKLDKLEAEFTDVTKQAKLLNKTGLSFGDKFKKKFKEYATYFSAASMFNYAERALRSMYDNVVEVDTAMTGLYRVTDLTATQYDMLYDNMVSSAKEYGSTLTDVINSTADWVRLGFDENEAVELSEITAMYQHISDLDYDVAVENLVTAYKGFQDQLLNLYNGDEVAAVRYIADIFNELDNNYAVTADDIGAALTRSASALQLAGNTIQESAAMVTGITEVTQDPEKAGKMYARTYSNVWCNL